MGNVSCTDCVHLRPPQPPPRPALPSRSASPQILKTYVKAIEKLQEIEQTEVDWVRQGTPFISVPRCFSWCAYWSKKATAEQRPDQYGNRRRIYELTRKHNKNNDCSAHRVKSGDDPSHDDE